MFYTGMNTIGMCNLEFGAKIRIKGANTPPMVSSIGKIIPSSSSSVNMNSCFASFLKIERQIKNPS